MIDCERKGNCSEHTDLELQHYSPMEKSLCFKFSVDIPMTVIFPLRSVIKDSEWNKESCC